MDIVNVNGVKKIYQMGDSKVYALNGVDFSMKQGEFVALIGSSGSGKSTLLNMLGTLDSPSEGEITISQTSLSELTQDERAIFRRKNIGFIFQNFNLIPVLNVYENIVLPLKLDGGSIDHKFMDELLTTLDLEDKKLRLPNTLSGGQQQRVAIARALLVKPAVILADEPTGNLDSKIGMEVMSMITTLSKKFDQSLIVVTHNEEVALMADRIVRMEDGKISEER